MADENEELNRRSANYQRQRREFDKTASAIRSTGEAMKVLAAAVDNYSDAVKRGDAISKDVYERGIRRIRDDFPRAWKKLGDSALKYKDVMNGVFVEQKSGMAVIEDRIGRVTSAMTKMLGMNRGQAAEAISGVVGRGQLYEYEQSLLSLKEDMKMRRALRNEGQNTAAIDERIAQRRIVLSEKAKNTTIAGQLQMKAVAENSSQGLTNLLSKDASALGGLAKAAVNSKSVVGTAMKAIMRTEALGAKGVAATGLSAGAAAVGSNLISAIGASLGPITAALGGIALASRIIIGSFARIGRESAVAGGQMRALAMNGKSDIGLLNTSMQGSISRIEEVAGFGGKMGAAMSHAFRDEIIPAAQKTLLTFNTLDRSKETINDWAGALAGAAIDGQSMGFSYEKSMGMIARQASVFGGSARQAREGFRAMAIGAIQAHTTTEKLEESLGGIESWAERFGRGGGQGTGGIFAEVGRKVSMSGLEGAERNMVMRSMSGMISNVPMLLGLGTSVMGQSKIFERYVGAVRGGEEAGKKLADLQGEVALGAIEGTGFGGPGGMSAGETIRSSKDAQAIWSAAQYAGTLTGISPDALMRPDFLKKYESFLGAGGDKTSKEYVRLRDEAASISGDMTMRGMTSIVQQQDILKSILSSVDRIAEVVGSFISSTTLGFIKMRPPAREDLSRSTKHLF